MQRGIPSLHLVQLGLQLLGQLPVGRGLDHLARRLRQRQNAGPVGLDVSLQHRVLLQLLVQPLTVQAHGLESCPARIQTFVCKDLTKVLQTE